MQRCLCKLVAHLQIKDKIQQHEVDRTDRTADWNANGLHKRGLKYNYNNRCADDLNRFFNS